MSIACLLRVLLEDPALSARTKQRVEATGAWYHGGAVTLPRRKQLIAKLRGVVGDACLRAHIHAVLASSEWEWERRSSQATRVERPQSPEPRLYGG